MALTRRQKEVLDFIAAYQVENGYSPSYEEIARGLELASIATVHKHISALQTKNYLHRSHNQSRSVEVAPRYLQEQRRNRFEASLEVPVLGTIAAGRPVEAYEDKTSVSFADFVGQKDTYALRVRGQFDDRRSYLRRRHDPGGEVQRRCATATLWWRLWGARKQR